MRHIKLKESVGGGALSITAGGGNGRMGLRDAAANGRMEEIVVSETYFGSIGNFFATIHLHALRAFDASRLLELDFSSMSEKRHLKAVLNAQTRTSMNFLTWRRVGRFGYITIRWRLQQLTESSSPHLPTALLPSCGQSFLFVCIFTTFAMFCFQAETLFTSWNELKLVETTAAQGALRNYTMYSDDSKSSQPRRASFKLHRLNVRFQSTLATTACVPSRSPPHAW